MKIYIEYIYIINFLLDFMILYGTKRLLKRNIKLFNLVKGSIIGTLTTFLLFIKISNITLFIIKIIISLLMNRVTFGNKDLFKNTLYFYLISIIIGGTIYMFNIKTKIISLIILLISPSLIIMILIKEMKNYKLNYQEKYNVRLTINNKIYNLEGFIDTGNHLKDPVTKKSVILVNLKLNINNVIYIPYKALNTEGIIPCIKPEKVEINNKEIKNCLIGLSKDKLSLPGVDCILPNILKEELCIN